MCWPPCVLGQAVTARGPDALCLTARDPHALCPLPLSPCGRLCLQVTLPCSSCPSMLVVHVMTAAGVGKPPDARLADEWDKHLATLPLLVLPETACEEVSSHATACSVDAVLTLLWGACAGGVRLLARAATETTPTRP